jgi:hypothetical protein
MGMGLHPPCTPMLGMKMADAQFLQITFGPF